MLGIHGCNERKTWILRWFFFFLKLEWFGRETFLHMMLKKMFMAVYAKIDFPSEGDDDGGVSTGTHSIQQHRIRVWWWFSQPLPVVAAKDYSKCGNRCNNNLHMRKRRKRRWMRCGESQWTLILLQVKCRKAWIIHHLRLWRVQMIQVHCTPSMEHR